MFLKLSFAVSFSVLFITIQYAVFPKPFRTSYVSLYIYIYIHMYNVVVVVVVVDPTPPTCCQQSPAPESCGSQQSLPPGGKERLHFVGIRPEVQARKGGW